MTLETYLAIALLHMAKDAMQTHEAKMQYRVASSFFLSMVWPLTSSVIILGVIYRQRHPNNDVTGETQKG
jgi:hypothetical protein